MKGKKVDIDFMNQYIVDCISDGLVTMESILSITKNKISEIDKQIIELEKLKKMRSKLIDIVNSFDKSEKDNSKAKTILKFFSVENKDIAKLIINSLDSNLCVKYQTILHKCHNYPLSDLSKCLKQLKDLDIIIYNNDDIFAGSFFEGYKRFISQ